MYFGMCKLLKHQLCDMNFCENALEISISTDTWAHIGHPSTEEVCVCVRACVHACVCTCMHAHTHTHARSVFVKAWSHFCDQMHSYLPSYFDGMNRRCLIEGKQL